ncbi:MAG: type II secretion system protein [bacterium]|nr:type II secretion system protein [bacterium]
MNKKNKAGFTLVEILVSLTIFSLMVVMVATIYVSAVSWERRVVATEKLVENNIFVVETMAREIRVSSISGPDSLGCTATTLTINHPTYGNVTYSLNGEGNVQRQTSSTVNVSSSNVKFSRMSFCIIGSGPIDNQPAKVTILLSLENRVGIQVMPISVQTTVTSRDIQSELEN